MTAQLEAILCACDDDEEDDGAGVQHFDAEVNELLEQEMEAAEGESAAEAAARRVAAALDDPFLTNMLPFPINIATMQGTPIGTIAQTAATLVRVAFEALGVAPPKLSASGDYGTAVE